MTLRLVSQVAIVVLILIGSSAVYPAPSDLDTSFGNSGISLSSLNNNSASIEEIILLPDGKIIAVVVVRLSDRDFVVARFIHDGSLDQTFGTAGMTVIPLLNDDNVTSRLVSPDGKIIIAGGSHKHFAIVRVTKDGDLDTSFGDNGVVITDVGVSFVAAIINAIGLQSDGRIVVAGNCHSFDICLVRYLSNG